MGLTPQARHFPRRNRLISGLAKAVVVIEAAAKSGTLITAAQALDQGRDVLAVPGHPIDGRAEGCNRLIRDGASLVRTIDDVLEILEAAPAPYVAPETARQSAFGFAEPPRQQPPQRQNIVDLHQQILDRIGPSPIAEDQLARDLECSPSTIVPAILELELKGRITRHPGGLLTKFPPRKLQ